MHEQTFLKACRNIKPNFKRGGVLRFGMIAPVLMSYHGFTRDVLREHFGWGFAETRGGLIERKDGHWAELPNPAARISTGPKGRHSI